MKKWKNDVFYDRRNLIIYLELFIQRENALNHYVEQKHNEWIIETWCCRIREIIATTMLFLLSINLNSMFFNNDYW
jgi:hypothetical protein